VEQVGLKWADLGMLWRCQRVIRYAAAAGVHEPSARDSLHTA